MTDQLTPTSPHGLGKRLADARRRGLEPQERRRIMEAVALRTGDGWRAQFAVLQSLSVAVAVMGLSANSAAVVIGAMLLAPLMVPVLGVAAAMSMALTRQLVRSLTVVVLASIGSIALAWLLARLLPDAQLSNEVLARTSPDLRDLVVALAAGAAGAYATVRKDVSSSLPGVAVAVALVPPLAAIGVTLEAGRRDLAEGAALLYATNLAAIILVGVVVFLLTGFVPPQRFRQTRLHVSLTALVVAGATLIIAVPLTVASIGASQTGRDRDQVYSAVSGWIQGAGDELDEVRIDDDVVRIRVSGPNPPPPTGELERTVQQILDPSTVVEVRWTQTQIPPTEDGPADPAEQDQLELERAVTAAVEDWLEDGDGAYEIERLDVADDIRIDLVSAVPPPPVEVLTGRIRDDLGLARPVVVNWTQRTTLVPADPDDHAETESLERLRRELDRVVRRWARGFDGLEVLTVDYRAERVTVDLAGPRPVPIDDLEVQVTELVPAGTDLEVWFIQRERLPATTTTTTTTSTTTTTTTTVATATTPGTPADESDTDG